jgi:hypothetical protein
MLQKNMLVERLQSESDFCMYKSIGILYSDFAFFQEI